MLSPDKHKTNACEGVLCLQQRLAYDLEGLGVAAGQGKAEGGRLGATSDGRLRTRHPVASLALALLVRRRKSREGVLLPSLAFFSKKIKEEGPRFTAFLSIKLFLKLSFFVLLFGRFSPPEMPD